MPKKRKNRAGGDWNELDDVQAELEAAGFPADLRLPPERALVEQIKAVVAERGHLTRLQAVAAELPDLRELADLGRRYRADLLEEAIAEGREAQGAGFDEASYRTLLEHATIEQLKTLRDDFRRSTRDRAFTAQAAVPRRPVV